MIDRYLINVIQCEAGWSAISQQFLRALSDVHPLIIAGSAAVVSAAFFAAYCKISKRRYKLKKDNEISSVVSQFVEERSKSEAILADLDIGVLAFSSDGMLINANPAARKMLLPSAIPERFKDFLDQYGHDNGLQAALLLGSESLSAKYQVENRVIRIRLKETRFDQERSAGTLVVLQDITDQEHEERQRKEFVANVSHELKTPLTTIKTYSESLLDWGLEEKSDEAIRKDVWRVHDDALRMERLVEDLLLLSSIDSRGIRVKMEVLDLSFLVRQVVERLQHQAYEKDIELACFTLSKIPVVYIDRTSMERVIVNLVGNAIKYTERGGSVKVYISYLLDDVCIKVADTGFGIEKEHLPRIFNRFYRVDMTGSRMFGGTGLGLSIAKELVELHGGHIDVNSVLGKGTEFTVMIPIARKVLLNTLEQVEDQTATLEPIYRFAASDLVEQALLLGMISDNLGELKKEQVQALIAAILDQDQEQAAPDNEKAKRKVSAFKTASEEEALEDMQINQKM